MPHDTSVFQQMLDYQEAYQGQGPVYFGRRKEVNPLNRPQGGALYPERRGENWTYERNKAFWAGAIDARRTFILVSDIETEAGALQNGYTCDEMRWLADVDYTFTPNPNDTRQTIARPPDAFSIQPSIRDYNKYRGTESETPRKRELRFQRIRTQILQQRQAFQQQAQP